MNSQVRFRPIPVDQYIRRQYHTSDFFDSIEQIADFTALDYNIGELEFSTCQPNHLFLTCEIIVSEGGDIPSYGYSLVKQAGNYYGHIQESIGRLDNGQPIDKITFCLYYNNINELQDVRRRLEESNGWARQEPLDYGAITVYGSLTNILPPGFDINSRGFTCYQDYINLSGLNRMMFKSNTQSLDWILKQLSRYNQAKTNKIRNKSTRGDVLTPNVQASANEIIKGSRKRTRESTNIPTQNDIIAKAIRKERRIKCVDNKRVSITQLQKHIGEILNIIDFEISPKKGKISKKEQKISSKKSGISERQRWQVMELIICIITGSESILNISDSIIKLPTTVCGQLNLGLSYIQSKIAYSSIDSPADTTLPVSNDYINSASSIDSKSNTSTDSSSAESTILNTSDSDSYNTDDSNINDSISDISSTNSNINRVGNVDPNTEVLGLLFDPLLILPPYYIPILSPASQQNQSQYPDLIVF